jgi:hypothetical protein
VPADAVAFVSSLELEVLELYMELVLVPPKSLAAVRRSESLVFKSL